MLSAGQVGWTACHHRRLRGIYSASLGRLDGIGTSHIRSSHDMLPAPSYFVGFLDPSVWQIPHIQTPVSAIEIRMSKEGLRSLHLRLVFRVRISVLISEELLSPLSRRLKSKSLATCSPHPVSSNLDAMLDLSEIGTFISKRIWQSNLQPGSPVTGISLSRRPRCHK